MVFDVQRLLALGRVSSYAVSPDGTWLAVAVGRYDDKTGKYVSWLYRVDTGQAATVVLTRGESNDRAPRFRSDGSLGFLSDRKRSGADAEARDQVWVFPKRGGDPCPLTDEPLGVKAFLFAKRGDLLAVIAEVFPAIDHDKQRAHAKELTEKGPSALHYKTPLVRHWDHWYGVAAPHVIAYDASGAGRRDLTPEADIAYRGDLAWDVSEDGTTVVIVERRLGERGRPDEGLRVLYTDSRASVLLGAAAGVSLGAPVLSPNARTVACTRSAPTSEAHGKCALASLDIGTGAVTLHAQSWDRWPIPMAFTSGSKLLVTAEEAGRCPIFSIDLQTDAVERLSAAATGHSFAAVAATDGHLFAIAHSLISPPEVYRLSGQPDCVPERVTYLSGFSEEEVCVEVRELTTPSTDGVSIHTYVVAPVGVAKPPVLLWIHGGPVGSFGDAWHWRWNPLVFAAAGYAIALPNARGSTGYGQAFVEGIWRNQWGAQCFEDLMAVADTLRADLALGGERMAAMGGSFGGYMTNWIGGHTARFRALVTHASIFHLEAFAGATDYPGFFQLELNASPRVAPAAVSLHSPHRFVSNWKSPTLILHGDKDYRVPIHDALILFDALQELSVCSELVVFPDENHWISRPRNVAAWYGHILRFLGDHMG